MITLTKRRLSYYRKSIMLSLNEIQKEIYLISEDLDIKSVFDNTLNQLSELKSFVRSKI